MRHAPGGDVRFLEMSALNVPLFVSPGIQRALRRSERRRLLVGLLVVAVVVSAVLVAELPGRGSVAPVPAKLTVLAVSESGRALFHLRCDPDRGNVAQPDKACTAIADQPSLVMNPRPFYDSGPNTAYFTITGQVSGKPIHFSGESSWTPQMALIEKLGLAGPHGQPLHLEPRRQRSVGLNKTRTFVAGILRPGDLATCRVPQSYRGPRLAMSVPIHRGFGGMLGATPGVIAVRVRADGAVIASCLARDRMPLDKRGRTTLPAGWPP